MTTLDIENLDANPGSVVCFIRVGRVWISGTNDRLRTSPKWKKEHSKVKSGARYSRHAEEHALQIIDKRWNVKPSNIKKVVVLRWRKDGSLGMAKPCIHCQKKLDDYGIRRSSIYFSNNEGKIEKYGNS